MRMEPPPSVPRAIGVVPAATLAAPPAVEPPGVLSRFQGLRVTPCNGLSPTALQPNSLVVVLPMMRAPCSRRRRTDGASKSATLSAMTREPKVHLTSFMATKSLTETGTPSRRPVFSPAMILFSDSPAAARATSGVISANALSLGWSASAWASAASAAATGDRSLAAMASRTSSAVM